MRVVDHEPHAWFLLEHEGALLLDAHVSWSAFTFTFVMALDDDERAAYETHGHDYLTQLAAAVQDSAPMSPDHGSPYADRNVADEHGQAVHAAVLHWRSTQA